MGPKSKSVVLSKDESFFYTRVKLPFTTFTAQADLTFIKKDFNIV